MLVGRYLYGPKFTRPLLIIDITPEQADGAIIMEIQGSPLEHEILMNRHRPDGQRRVTARIEKPPTFRTFEIVV